MDGIGWLSTIWQSDREFFLSVAVLVLLYGYTPETAIRKTTFIMAVDLPSHKPGRTRHAEHSWRSKDEPLSDVMWIPTPRRYTSVA